MRRSAAAAAVLALVAGCAPAAKSPAPSPVSSSGARTSVLDPARFNRIRGEFPPGYEVAPADGVGSPAVFWGLRDRWVAEPPPCAALVVAGDPASARGLSASGPGGTTYVALVDAVTAPDPAPAGECEHWTMSNAHSTATMAAADAPEIADARTTGLSATIRTVVESGTETDATAHTYTAYVPGQAVFVTLVTDPGAPAPPLPPRFAADLLTASVAALRG